MAECASCRQEYPAYYLAGGLCDGCRWDTWIPGDYSARERYEYDPAWGHANRTRRPATGIDFLDSGPSVFDALRMANYKVRL